MTTTANSVLLPLKGGDMVGILLLSPTGWWLGEVNSQRGWVPSAFLDPPPAQLLESCAASVETKFEGLFTNPKTKV